MLSIFFANTKPLASNQLCSSIFISVLTRTIHSVCHGFYDPLCNITCNVIKRKKVFSPSLLFCQTATRSSPTVSSGRVGNPLRSAGVQTLQYKIDHIVP